MRRGPWARCMIPAPPPKSEKLQPEQGPWIQQKQPTRVYSFKRHSLLANQLNLYIAAEIQMESGFQGRPLWHSCLAQRSAPDVICLPQCRAG
jgi:hypothetical protein